MKGKLNIAMSGHKRIPSREGGIEIVVEELSTRMVEVGHSVTCYNRSGHHVSGKEFDGGSLKEYKGVKLKLVLTINHKGLAAMTSSFFGAICAAFGKYDVVHFHAEGPCAMLWLPKFFGKKCIATIHGIDWQRAKWGGFASKYIKFGEKVAAKYADEIIVLSEGVQKYFMDTYGRKTVFIPNGVNRPILRSPQLIKEKYGLDKDFKMNVEANHATLAAHTFQHELRVARDSGAFRSIDAIQGDMLLGWDTDQFPTNVYETALCMYEVLKAGGFTKGGLNFDAKTRRGSNTAEDIFLAYIAGMDAFALGLRIADKMIRDGRIDKFVDDRYASYKTGIGKKIVDGTVTMAELEAYALEMGDVTTNISGKQEYLEGVMNALMF